jgi:DNA-binding IclR family transcriptional regulator
LAEYETVSNCIATPAWHHARRAAGGISITKLKPKVDLAALKELLPILLETTSTISAELDWRPGGGSRRPLWGPARRTP